MSAVCHWEPRLSVYRDGELSTEERQQLAAHIAICPHCQGSLCAWSQIAHWVRLESLPTRGPQVAEALGELRRTGAFKEPLAALLLQRLDALFVRPRVSFGTAMTVALALALLLVNAPHWPAAAAEQLRRHIEHILRGLIPFLSL